MTKNIQKNINELAKECLLNHGNHSKYSDEDLMDAVLIFMEVFMAKTYDKHCDKLTHPQLEKLFGEAGKSLRQTVRLFTGTDLTKVLRK